MKLFKYLKNLPTPAGLEPKIQATATSRGTWILKAVPADARLKIKIELGHNSFMAFLADKDIKRPINQTEYNIEI